MLTKQEIYDTVKTHLLTQNKKSCDDYGECVYRGPNGLKCAIGILISDEDYVPEMEAGSDVGMYDIAYACNIDLEFVPMMISLQVVHDTYDPKYWPERLDYIKEKYNLC